MTTTTITWEPSAAVRKAYAEAKSRQAQTSLAAELIAEIGTYSEPDYTAAVIAHRFGVSSDAIIDTVAEIAERLTIAEDLREDPEHAMFLHYDETYHGGDMSGLIEHELDAAHQYAEKLAEMVTRP